MADAFTALLDAINNLLLHMTKIGGRQPKIYISYSEKWWTCFMLTRKKYELGYVIPKEGLCVYSSQCCGYKQNLYEMEYTQPKLKMIYLEVS